MCHKIAYIHLLSDLPLKRICCIIFLPFMKMCCVYWAIHLLTDILLESAFSGWYVSVFALFWASLTVWSTASWPFISRYFPFHPQQRPSQNHSTITQNDSWVFHSLSVRFFKNIDRPNKYTFTFLWWKKKEYRQASCLCRTFFSLSLLDCFLVIGFRLCIFGTNTT